MISKITPKDNPFLIFRSVMLNIPIKAVSCRPEKSRKNWIHFHGQGQVHGQGHCRSELKGYGQGQCKGEVEGHGQEQCRGKVEGHGQGQYRGKFEGHGQGKCRSKVVGHEQG